MSPVLLGHVIRLASKLPICQCSSPRVFLIPPTSVLRAIGPRQHILGVASSWGQDVDLSVGLLFPAVRC